MKKLKLNLNNANSVEKLTRAQLKNVFGGQSSTTTNWWEWNPFETTEEASSNGCPPGYFLCICTSGYPPVTVSECLNDTNACMSLC